MVSGSNLMLFQNFNFYVKDENSLTLISVLGVKMTLSTLLDGENINTGGHKLGLELEFEA